MQETSSMLGEHGARRWAIIATLGMFVLHLLAAASTDLDFDEAYYALWARNLSWGYVDHPPMVAVWISLSTAVFGDSPFGVRALTAIATALGTVGLVATARLLYPQRPALGWIAALMFCTMPLPAVAGFVTTPDVPLVAFWTMSVLGLAIIWSRGSAWAWLVVGLCTGLALQSKYSGFFLGAGIVSAMLAVPSLRRWFTHPMPYVGGLLALAIFAPVVMWNAGHEWVSFHKQFGRAAGSTYSGAYIGEYVGALAGLTNPAVFAMAGGAFWLAWRKRTTTGIVPGGDDEARRLLLALTIPMLLYFLKHALHDRVQGNWFAPVLPLLALLAADWATSGPSPRWDMLARWRAVVWSTIICAGIAVLSITHLVTGLLPVPASRDVALQRLRGWRGLAADVAALAPQGAAVLTSSYSLAAHLQVYGEVYAHHPIEVDQLNERGRWFFQEAGRSSVSLRGRRAQVDAPPAASLYISEAGREQLDLVRSRFASVREVNRIERRFAGRTLRSYIVYRLEGPSAPRLMEPSFKLPL